MAVKLRMVKGQLVVKQSSPTLAVLSWTFRIAWRFFLGKPMNGKTRDNSSFLHGATRITLGQGNKRILSRWQKKPQFHRALIRGAVFWPLLGTAVLAVFHPMAALFVLAFSFFPLAFLAVRKGRFLFFDPYTTTDAVSGVSTQHWLLKNSVRKLFRLQPVPGYMTKKQRAIDPELPHEIQEAIRAELANNNYKRISPVFGPITRYRRNSPRDGRRKKVVEQ